MGKNQKVDSFIEKKGESNAVKMFREKCELALAQIPDLDSFRASDPMVDYVFKIGADLFKRPLDTIQEGELVRTGGKLTGAYVYLGQKSVRARAVKDVYEQKLDETEKELTLTYYAEDEQKITHSRAKAKVEVGELQQFVIQKNAEKNQWENITMACDKMVSFIQSAIKVKEGERFKSSKNYGNS